MKFFLLSVLLVYLGMSGLNDAAMSADLFGDISRQVNLTLGY